MRASDDEQGINKLWPNLLFHVHMRLNKILGSVTQEPFAGLTIIAVEDVFQLPPVERRPVYLPYRNFLRYFNSF